MKIFISHSSRDKWAARRIAAEISLLGVATFLDEKDIETGESIDDAVAKHLRECDELLVLLSPASIKSDWVLVEVGGAKALGKRLVPILLYLSANEIPSPISKHLARDINNIEQYYAEVKDRLSANAPPPEPEPRREPQVRRRSPPVSFRVGDFVRLPSNPQRLAERASSPSISWEEGMDVFVGRRAEITLVDDDRSVKLDVDGGVYWWAFEWLEKIE
jgi:hypothetical protein